MFHARGISQLIFSATMSCTVHHGDVSQIFVQNTSHFEDYTSGKTKAFYEVFMATGDLGYLDQARATVRRGS